MPPSKSPLSYRSLWEAMDEGLSRPEGFAVRCDYAHTRAEKIAALKKLRFRFYSAKKAWLASERERIREHNRTCAELGMSPKPIPETTAYDTLSISLREIDGEPVLLIKKENFQGFTFFDPTTMEEYHTDHHSLTVEPGPGDPGLPRPQASEPALSLREDEPTATENSDSVVPRSSDPFDKPLAPGEGLGLKRRNRD